MIEFFEYSDSFYIALESVSGGSLFDYLQKREFSLEENRIKEIAY